jgi:hypothetical protein
LRIDSLPSNEDSIQATLVFILSNNISEDLLQEVLTRLWYLWKARNDFRFNNKKWSVGKVAHKVKADIQSSSFIASLLVLCVSTTINPEIMLDIQTCVFFPISLPLLFFLLKFRITL